MPRLPKATVAVTPVGRASAGGGGSGAPSSIAVAISAPAAGATITAGIPVTITGTITKPGFVIVSIGSTQLGAATVVGLSWSYSWTPLSADVGNRTINASATDFNFVSTASATGVAVTIVSTPLSIDGARLIAWHTVDETVAGGNKLKSSGPGTKPLISIQGSKAALGGTTLIIDSVAGGTGTGQATFSTYIDGGTTPIATGTVTSSTGVALTGACLGEIAICPAGTYAVGQRWDQYAAAIIDQSNQGGDIWASNADFSPTLESVGWNGKPSILFDGTASLIYADGQDLANRVCGGLNTEFHMYAMIQLLATTAGQCVMNFGALTGNPAGWYLSVAAGPVWQILKRGSDNTSVTITGGVPDTARHLLEFHLTGTVQTMLIDGVNVTLSNGGALSTTTLGTLLASGLGLQKTTGASGFCNMRFRERVIFGAGHTDFAGARAYMLANSPL